MKDRMMGIYRFPAALLCHPGPGRKEDLQLFPSAKQSEHFIACFLQIDPAKIDEAQRIPNIGLSMKIFVDEIKGRQLIASGSSSFDLANKTEEPLTGRKYEYTLLPLSFAELTGKFGLIEEKGAREQRLLFGSYPDVVNKIIQILKLNH